MGRERRYLHNNRKSGQSGWWAPRQDDKSQGAAFGPWPIRIRASESRTHSFHHDSTLQHIHAARERDRSPLRRRQADDDLLIQR